MTGTLARWQNKRGFGFIRPDDGGDDVFVHVNSIDIRQRIAAGLRVRFDVGLNEKNPARIEAKNVVATGLDMIPGLQNQNLRWTPS